MILPKLFSVLLLLQIAWSPNAAGATDGLSTGQLPVDQAVRDKLNEAMDHLLSPPTWHLPGAVKLGRLTQAEWDSVRGDLDRYGRDLEEWRKKRGHERFGQRGNCIHPDQLLDLRNSIQDWFAASSREWRRYAQVFKCEEGLMYGWRCLEARTNAEIWVQFENRKPNSYYLMLLDIIDEFMPAYLVFLNRDVHKGTYTATEGGDYARYVVASTLHDKPYEAHYLFFF
ncbi:unnamed protein product, partial [Mesorhabditis spiculigera]